MVRLLIAASGTGGHIFPALSVAEELPVSWEISWLGVPSRLENVLVPKKFQMTLIPVDGLQGNGLKKVFQLIKLIASSFLVIRLIRRKRIQVVFSTGGYIAAPAIIASKICGVKVILHESNAFPGKVTRLLGIFCDEVALGIPHAKEKLISCKTICTGTPVRKSFLLKHALPRWVPQGCSPLIVVMGGSQGAVGLNNIIKEILPTLLSRGFRIVHITGENSALGIKNRNLVEKTFTNDIPGLFQHAHLVITRAGSGALSELAVCGTPAIFVPYPYAADNHQECNAVYAALHGGAFIIHQHQSSSKTLQKTIELLFRGYLSNNSIQNDLLEQMSKGMKRIASSKAHLKLVKILISYV
ncbi:UDP-N-acetylglucosamine--N-acetylmuramyl-(pentapeptide) pyrophosphoryl-undecaprenol N-acetylglucosamine transferase [Prochlorococcus marinus]|uniref:UDP-N-acetylglucosamine--N-acetylmuramyl- (pentapeptide) pyrophosphoryl-undecaprenol N-acetylglucosamine transferase n=1 Tax=Prochlorococcus marinus TaxID=1219 RepID=UPI0022B5842F|nr:UDP-N-acetylglucosamine--N-acetylmuramyl-(pentapeptide) pyrophosphoryl-undecaprenol N-acetylglucosamine transferase [Prochlorococcus marinus]